MKYLFLICFLAIGINGDSQITVVGGINVSSIRQTNFIFSQESASRIGYHVGVHYKSDLGSSFAFNPAVIYSQKGAGFGAFVPTLDLNYLDFPLMFVYQKYPDQSFFAEAGPYLGFLVSAYDGVNDVKDSYNSLDMGLGIGAGYDLGRMVLGGRGMIGLTNIPNLNTGTTQDTRTTNISGQLYLGFQL